MKTIRIGIADEATTRQRMLDIVSGRSKTKPQEPTIWVRSVDELSKLLSSKNINLLAAVRNNHPKSINDLAKKMGTDQGNLTKRLKNLASYGLVEFHKGMRIKGKTALIPTVPFDQLVPPSIFLDSHNLN